MVAFCVAFRYDPSCAVLRPVRVEIAHKSASIHSKTGQERSDRVLSRHGKDGEMARVVIEPVSRFSRCPCDSLRVAVLSSRESRAACADRHPNAADAGRDAR